VGPLCNQGTTGGRMGHRANLLISIAERARVM
jgi:hypothetical protein